MENTAILNNLGYNNRSVDVRLTLDYWLAKVYTRYLSLVLWFLKTLMVKLIGNVNLKLIKLCDRVVILYDKLENIDKEKAEEIYPDIIELRKIIIKQKNNFSKIDKSFTAELDRTFLSLIRLINRTEARVYRKIYEGADSPQTPSYIKEKAALNSKKAIKNALLKETDS